MKRTLFTTAPRLALGMLLLGFAAGCASDNGGSSRAPEEEVSRDRDVSKVPWTKPASWEGGSIGGVNPGLGN
ncbi:MAG: hypothetical protein AAGK14_12730 [Verrucomicrobiota bacterium]